MTAQEESCMINSKLLTDKKYGSTGDELPLKLVFIGKNIVEELITELGLERHIALK